MTNEEALRIIKLETACWDKFNSHDGTGCIKIDCEDCDYCYSSRGNAAYLLHEAIKHCIPALHYQILAEDDLK